MADGYRVYAIIDSWYRLGYRITIPLSIIGNMDTVTVSPKFQVVIPRAIRESLGLSPGTKVQVLQYENRIEFIPQKKMRQMRGFLKGIETNIERDKDRV